MYERSGTFPSGKIYKVGLDIADALCIYDSIEPNTEAWEKFRLFLELLDYCTRHKMYNVRDNAIKKLIKDIYY